MFVSENMDTPFAEEYHQYGKYPRRRGYTGKSGDNPNVYEQKHFE